MGKYCEICKKGVMSGNLVSHSNRKTRTTWAPNIQTVHAVVNGTVRKVNARRSFGDAAFSLCKIPFFIIAYQMRFGQMLLVSEK